MKYTKRPLTFDEQVQQLVDRGLEGDPATIRNRLQSVNYYRLTGYLYPYRIQGSDNFVPGTQFETVWEQYAFDRRLRLLVMDAIERIEIAVRAQLAYHHAHTYHDPFAYATQPISLPDMKPEAFAHRSGMPPYSSSRQTTHHHLPSSVAPQDHPNRMEASTHQ